MVLATLWRMSYSREGERKRERDSEKRERERETQRSDFMVGQEAGRPE